jgi:hypothetical protein
MRKSIRTAGLIIGIIALAGMAVAQSVETAARSGDGEPRFEPNQIVFKPGVGKVGLDLTVAGPTGFRFEKSFEPGVPPKISVHDLEDGLYSYELRIVLTNGSDDAESAGAKRPVVPPNERGLNKRATKTRDPIVQSGHFRVKAGSIVTRDEAESSAVVERSHSETDSGDGAVGAGVTSPDKDFVINDDLIVDGSACIGFDCVNGESFSFDTIRLKENNLRIKFDDTSVAASYPRNDWQLTANDSANGGASKFSIDDISGNRTPFTVEANARSHSLYIDDGGRIGSRTSTPSVEIHTIDGDTPTLRLQQDGSSGFAPQTWDLAGNETNFFIRDVTNGSQLPFRIRPDAPTNSIFIDVDGDVGVGTSSPDQELDIESNADPAFRLSNSAAAGGSWDVFMNSNTGRFNIRDNGTNDIPFKLDPGADNNLLQLGVNASGQVDINGDLVVSGTITPDYVFEPDYQLESIEDHAEYMWTNKHLPAVGAATLRPDGSHAVNVGARSQSMLEELEKAHIYIEQLHATIKELQNDQLKATAAVEELQNRLEKLERETNH